MQDAQILDKEYFSDNNCNMDDWKYPMRREMQEIVPGLLLGPFSVCREIEYLRNNGITHIICLLDQSESRLFRFETLESQFPVLKFDVADNHLQNLILLFPEVSLTIRNAISENHRILICCSGGLSRSPTFVIAYVMEEYGIDASTAYHFVQGKRLCINPNDGFKSQLKEYEPISKARRTNNNSTNLVDQEIHIKRPRSDSNDVEDSAELDSQQADRKRFLLEGQQRDTTELSTAYPATML